MILFAALELQPWFQRLAAPLRLIPIGGIITGFFGGLTGQQGAFRSMFLLKSGLDPTRFIATGVLIAVLVDLVRLPTYAASFHGDASLGGHGWAMVGVGTLCAFVGAFLGVRYLKKATIGVVRAMVAGLMLLIGVALVKRTGLHQVHRRRAVVRNVGEAALARALEPGFQAGQQVPVLAPWERVFQAVRVTFLPGL